MFCCLNFTFLIKRPLLGDFFFFFFKHNGVDLNEQISFFFSSFFSKENLLFILAVAGFCCTAPEVFLVWRCRRLHSSSKPFLITCIYSTTHYRLEMVASCCVSGSCYVYLWLNNSNDVLFTCWTDTRFQWVRRTCDLTHCELWILKMSLQMLCNTRATLCWIQDQRSFWPVWAAFLTSRGSSWWARITCPSYPV